MPALDLALRLWVIRCATDMLDAPAVEPFGQIAGDIGGTIVGQQPRAVDDRDLIEPGGRQRQVERLSDISGPHRGAELPGDDEASHHVGHGPIPWCFSVDRQTRCRYKARIFTGRYTWREQAIRASGSSPVTRPAHL